MSGVVVVDASVIVSWLITADSNHIDSRLWLERFRATNGLLIAPTLLPVEVAAAIARPTKQVELAKNAARTLYSIRTLRLITVGSTLTRLAVNIAADLQLRAADATYVAVAHKLG